MKQEVRHGDARKNLTSLTGGGILDSTTDTTQPPLHPLKKEGQRAEMMQEGRQLTATYVCTCATLDVATLVWMDNMRVCSRILDFSMYCGAILRRARATNLAKGSVQGVISE